MKRGLGIYYDMETRSVLMGFVKIDSRGRESFVGSVIGSLLDHHLRAFHPGYKYDGWSRGNMIYMGKTRNYVTYDGYREFLDWSTNEQIVTYLKIKNEVLTFAYSSKTKLIHSGIKIRESRRYHERAQ